VLTSLGEVRLQRTYFHCAHCRQGEYAADELLGVTDYLTTRLRRLACLAGADKAFEPAAVHVHEFLGVRLSAEKLRLTCHGEAKEMIGWHAQADEVATIFEQASGECEFQTDATKVNTLEGWRDLKIACFLKRPCGDAALPEEWATRKLPAPTARVVWAQVGGSDVFARTWRPWAAQLGITDAAQISVLADGADWIWNEQRSQFPTAEGVLDIFHAAEHLSDTGKRLFGEGSEKADAWLAESRQALLGRGWLGWCDQVGRVLAEDRRPETQGVMDELNYYLFKHRDHLEYARRLAEGRSIGSGMIESTCKQLGKRLKQSGARWNVANVPGMATLCSLRHSSHWEAYWSRN
jgi:hypothetical protein